MFHSWRVERKTIAITTVVTRDSLSACAGALRIISSRCAWMLHMCFVLASSTWSSSDDSHSRTSLAYHTCMSRLTSPHSKPRSSACALASFSATPVARASPRKGLPHTQSCMPES